MTELFEWVAAGLIYGPAPHYIDHLAPLCSLLDIPLFVTEEEEERLIRTFYPEVRACLVNSIALPDLFVQEIDVAFLCTPRVLFDEIFFFPQKLRNKKVHTIWVPHGNSDKGHLSPSIEGLNQEEIALVYGDKMIDFLKEKKAFDQLKKHVAVGNYRRSYYFQRKAFYDQMLERELSRKLPRSEKTILYAPTWKDKESSSSFSEALPFMIERLPPNWNLIIKPHPNLLMENEERNRILIEKYEKEERVCFLQHFPPVFPLLSIADIYVGDFSSIGYDFLGFNRPMFFLNQSRRNVKTDPGLYLYQCGIEIQPEDYSRLYDIIRTNLPNDSRFESIRTEIDRYTFAPRKSIDLLKKEIQECYKCFPDKDLNFF